MRHEIFCFGDNSIEGDVDAFAAKYGAMDGLCIISDKTIEFNFAGMKRDAFKPNVVDEFQHRTQLTRIALATKVVGIT